MLVAQDGLKLCQSFCRSLLRAGITCVLPRPGRLMSQLAFGPTHDLATTGVYSPRPARTCTEPGPQPSGPSSNDHPRAEEPPSARAQPCSGAPRTLPARRPLWLPLAVSYPVLLCLRLLNQNPHSSLSAQPNYSPINFQVPAAVRGCREPKCFQTFQMLHQHKALL